MNSQTQSENVVVQQTQVAYDDAAYFNSFPIGFRFCPFDDELINGYLMKKVMNKPLPRNRIPEIELSKHNPEHLAGSTIPKTSRGPNDMKLDDWVLCRIYRKPDKSSTNEAPKRKRKGGDSSDGCEDSGPILNPTDNYNMPEMECNNDGKMDDYMYLSKKKKMDDNMGFINQSGETCGFVHNFSYQSNIRFVYEDPSSFAEPSVSSPMDFIEDMNQLSSCSTWPANDEFNLVINHENYDMLTQFDFLNDNHLNTVNFVPHELLSNTIEMPPLPGEPPLLEDHDATEMSPDPR
ncbi:hypothetical protein NE237_000909 [Protea cynaroides]|uniref:NAC domain-containing protein n=1 Tax=Protea cynaroides TaxID=273540 RepID=A0A9Q0KS61_9MAGN|nr:hypothetical protein NE237_000909 [Protea cynaroides]